MARKKTEECPVCGDKFSPQGLTGHIRMAHGVDSADDRSGDEEANEREEVVRRSTQTVELVDQLSEIGRRKDEVDQWSRSNLFRIDKGAKEMKEALDSLEERIRDRLAKRDANGEAAKATVQLEKELKQVCQLIDRFADCRKRREEIEGSSLSSKTEAEEALDEMEREIRGQLEKVSKRTSSTSNQSA